MTTPADDPPADDSPDRAAPAHALPRELVASGEYEDVAELGRGGMGVVYRARNTLMGRVEVLKVMGREVMTRPGAADRFRREIQSAARLNHPNVVGAYAARMVSGLLVFSMEYVPGEDFDRLVKARGPLPVAHAAYYARQVADGLQHAHEQEMVHRDIKPANLILSTDGKRPLVKILDFGLARVTREEQDAPRLTAAGRMLGTPDYVAPEQANDAQAADIRSDIYSLGCTLYFFLTGRPPFRAGSVVGVLLQHRDKTAELLNAVRPDVPARLAAVVARMLEKDPAGRYQTPAEVGEALAPFAAGWRGGAPHVDAVGASVELVQPPVPGPTWRPQPHPGALQPVLPHPSAWESLPSQSQSAVAAPSGYARPRRNRHKPALMVTAAAAVMLAGLIGAVALTTIGVGRSTGTVVIEDLPRDAEVEVDGRKVATAREGDDATMELPRGRRYRVRIVRGTLELYSEIVSLDDGTERIRYRPPPPPAPARTTRPTQKAPAGPTFTAAERRRWVHDKGWFNAQGGGEWEEASPAAVTHRFRETDRTPLYVEMTHLTLDRVVRLYGERCDVLDRSGKSHGTFYTGGWVGSDVELVQPVASSSAPPAPTPTPTVPAPPSRVPSPPPATPPVVRGWKVEGSELVGSNPGGAPLDIFFGKATWVDADLAFEVKPVGGRPDFVVSVRYKADNTRVWATFGPARTDLQAWFGNWSCDAARMWAGTGGPQDLKGARTVPTDEWFTVKLSARGQAIESTVDGKSWARFPSIVPQPWAGQAALSVKSGVHRFRNIRVTSPTGAVLWNRLPDPP